MAGTERSGGGNARIPRSLTRAGVEVGAPPWLRRRPGSKLWTRERIRKHIGAWLAELGAVESEAARDAVAALADHHFLLQVCAARIAESPTDPAPIGKRDPYAVQATTHVLVARCYRSLGLWPLKAHPKAATARKSGPSKLLLFERPR